MWNLELPLLGTCVVSYDVKGPVCHAAEQELINTDRLRLSEGKLDFKGEQENIDSSPDRKG